MYFPEKLKRRLLFITSFACLFGVLVAVQFIPGGTKRQELSHFEQEQISRAEGLRFRALSLQDEYGRIDPDGLRKARAHIEEMKKVQPDRQRAREGQLQETALAPDSWTWLGPGNIGGRIRSMVIKPNNPNDMLAGSVSGGIWRTTNAGASWFPVDDLMANLAISTMIISPTDPNILYAGTGEGFGNISSNFAAVVQGAGVFRSNNGGTSWSQLSATNNPDFTYVNRLAISPNGATLLASTNTGVFRSGNGGTTWTQEDFGQSLDIDFHPTDNNRAIAGENGRARYSTDGGQSWTSAKFRIPPSPDPTPITGRVELAYAPSSPNVVYAAVNMNDGELYRSNDGGENYTRVNTGNSFFNSGGGNQGGYDNIVWVNPQDPNFVIVGGIENLRSTNGGTTFMQMSNSSFGQVVHADQHFIIAHPGFNNNTNKTVFFTNDGGIYRTDSVDTAMPTTGWTILNNNLGVTQFYGGAGNPDTGVIMGGTQDNGNLRFFGATTWQQPERGDGAFVAADLSDSSYFYCEKENLAIRRSFNGGETFTQIISGLTDSPSAQTNFYAPIALDQLNPTKLLAGGWSLWRTDNVRTTANWSPIKPPTPGNWPISAIAFSPDSSNYIVVGHNNGDVYVTFVGSAANPVWTKIDDRTNGLPNNRFLTRLVVDQTRTPRWIYATFGGFSSDNVYVSRDQGASWIDITGSGPTGLPDVPVRTLAIHPHDRNLLYVGTEVGIFTSQDAGATWDIAQGAPANVSTDELFWMAGDLIAATHGRGMFRASGGLYVDCNFTGFQLGTFNQPYRTINAAINAVGTRYVPIWVKSCTYNESINTSKRLEIRGLGTGTIVGQ